MMILLDEKESAAYLASRPYRCSEEERMTMESIKFAPLPDNCRSRPLPLTDAKRAAIIELYDDGCGLSEISETLNLPIAQIRGAIGAYCVKKARRRPVGEVSVPKVAIPEEPSELAPIEPTTRQDRIDAIILSMARTGAWYVDIAAEVNNQMGAQFMPNDVAARLEELRGDKA
jgi:hypothetical protein